MNALLLLFVTMMGMTAATVTIQGASIEPKCNCPLEPACGENEAIFQCAPCIKTCEQLGQPIACPRLCAAKGSCFCKAGYLRSKDGKCIPQEHCPSTITCGLNEEKPSCVPCTQTCADVLHTKFCAAICQIPDRCYCKEGYVRGDNGKCIPKKCCFTLRDCFA